MIYALWTALPYALVTFWLLATGAAVIALLPWKFADSFRAAVYLSACRGKLWEGKPVGALGPCTILYPDYCSIQDWKVPQRWFAHFYNIGVMANTLLLLFVAYRFGIDQGPVYLALALLEVHLARRCLETYFLMKYPTGSTMHVIAYGFGLVYYAVLPLTCLPAWILTLPAEELFLDLSLASLRPHKLGSTELAGSFIFLAGNWLQHNCHQILADLSDQKPSSSANDAVSANYKIPFGGAFEWVSCPHYLGEIVIYFGLTLVMGPTRLLSWLPLIWVVVNLALAAGPTHEWYKQKFDSYPAHRRALIPYVY